MDIFEIFEDLKVKDEIVKEFSGVEVSKIQKEKRTGDVAICILSTRILDKRLLS